MSWTDAIEDRWGGRNGTIRLALRLIGLGFFGYLLITSGAFTGPLWVAIGTGAAIAISLALIAMRAWRPFDRWALVLTTALMALGVVLNPSIDYLGSVFFVLGGIILVGQPEVPLRLGVSITAVLSIGLVVRAVLANPEWTVLLSTLFGAVAVVLFGANRRQRVLRLRETARVTELEQRSRIARDLHDVLAHSLGGLVVQLDAAAAELERGQTAEAATRILVSRQLAVEGLREARTAVEELRTGAERVLADDPTDLVDALERVLRGPVGLQLAAELDVVGDRRPVSAAVAHALTSTTREALTNVNKHAAGAQVSVTVMFEPAALRLEIVNGLATPQSPADELAGTGGGLGLAGCRERMTRVGGRLDAGREGRRWVVSAECPTSDLPTMSAEQRSGATSFERRSADGELRR
jgi:signal transduction histidine kinase